MKAYGFVSLGFQTTHEVLDSVRFCLRGIPRYNAPRPNPRPIHGKNIASARQGKRKEKSRELIAFFVVGKTGFR